MNTESSIFDIANAYASAGLSVVPIRTDGSKAPAIPAWAPLQERPMTAEEIRRWFKQEVGIGIICGAVSGNLEIIDFDEPELFEPWGNLVTELGGADLLKRVVIIKTPGGWHVGYRCTEPVEGNRKLASRCREDGLSETLIETRGQGGYIVAPGSPPECHPDHRTYELKRNSLSELPMISNAERQLLLNAARSFNEVVRDYEHAAEPKSSAGTRPGDDYNASVSVDELVAQHQWQLVYRNGDKGYWKRPGKKEPGISATTNHNGSKRLYVFSSNAAPFEPDRSYTAFEIYALLEHGGDFKAAARKLASEGYGREQRESTASAQQQAHAAPEAWPEPKHIRTDLLPITPMSGELMPEPISDWIMDTAHRMQCPIEGVATAAIVVISGIIGAGSAIRPKAKDDWTVIPNLWGALIGRPGVVLKSPTLKAIMAPVYALEDAASKAHRQTSKGYEADTEVYKARQASIKNSMKTVKDGCELEKLRQSYMDLTEPEPVPKRRYVLNDTTTEAANKILADNPRGLIHFRDELTGWLASLDKDGREGDRAFYLETYDGNGRKRDDRISRDSVENPNLCLAVLGGIQPDKLEKYLFDAMHRMDNDGLIQRFQLMVFPDEPSADTIVDEIPNREARERAYTIIKTIAGMDFLAAGATDPGDGSRPFFRFDEEAQRFFLHEWLPDHIRKERQESHSMMQEHLVKYRKLMPALSLIFHLINVADKFAKGEEFKASGIDRQAAERAAAWCDVLEEHARRIYGIVANVTAKATAELAKRIKKGELSMRFTVRDVHRRQWRFLTEVEVVRAACEELADSGCRWLFEEISEPDWQRKRVCTYVVNPKVKDHGKVSESISP